jgi:hypothetical protein
LGFFGLKIYHLATLGLIFRGLSQRNNHSVGPAEVHRRRIHIRNYDATLGLDNI